MDSATDSIRNKVKGVCESRGVTAYALAKNVGVHPGTIKRWFDGINSLSSDVASRCVDYLGIELKERNEKRTKQTAASDGQASGQDSGKTEKERANPSS